jgi:hypothetical protein
MDFSDKLAAACADVPIGAADPFVKEDTPLLQVAKLVGNQQPVHNYRDQCFVSSVFAALYGSSAAQYVSSLVTQARCAGYIKAVTAKDDALVQQYIDLDANVRALCDCPIGCVAEDCVARVRKALSTSFWEDKRLQGGENLSVGQWDPLDALTRLLDAYGLSLSGPLVDNALIFAERPSDPKFLKYATTQLEHLYLLGKDLLLVQPQYYYEDRAPGDRRPITDTDARRFPTTLRDTADNMKFVAAVCGGGTRTGHFVTILPPGNQHNAVLYDNTNATHGWQPVGNEWRKRVEVDAAFLVYARSPVDAPQNSATL